jgi:hypothetical protein
MTRHLVRAEMPTILGSETAPPESAGDLANFANSRRDQGSEVWDFQRS